MYRIFVLAILSMYLVACVRAPNRIAEDPLTPTPGITEPVCQPSLVQISKNSFPEIQGTMKSDGEMWALLFFGEAHAKEDLKIVWKITGTGQGFTAEAQHEDGTFVSPIWGPEAHGGSTWKRPGAEFGTGFNFPKPGCWKLTVTLGETKGEISLNVLPSRQS